ncbi:hypothetical protein ACMD2_13305 [Ananas comosus]|uniref:Uncharacterized protein n=1 Tax=Ananas comosus TaxID=4615 RepID=A0A199UJ87_ANACO|nr:hypothetical protein ACMD2_13305 [Ananas comosus]
MVFLELGALEFRYDQQGILQISCIVEHFRMAVDLITRNKRRSALLSAPLGSSLDISYKGDL